MKLRKSHYSLKYGGVIQFAMKRNTLWNGHTQLMFAFSDLGRPRVLSFSERRVIFIFPSKIRWSLFQRDQSTISSDNLGYARRHRHWNTLNALYIKMRCSNYLGMLIGKIFNKYIKILQRYIEKSMEQFYFPYFTSYIYAPILDIFIEYFTKQKFIRYL